MRHAWKLLDSEFHQCSRCGMERKRSFRIFSGINPWHAGYWIWEYRRGEAGWRWKKKRQPIPKCKGAPPGQRELVLREET